MGRRAQFKQEDFFRATLSAVAKYGPSKISIAAIGQELQAPVGSIYHRYKSLRHLLAETWLTAAEDFQSRFIHCVMENKGLEAALCTPGYSREARDQARFLLCYNREEFITGPWPQEVMARAAELKQNLRLAFAGFLKKQPGRNDQKKKAKFELALIHMPLAATKPWLKQSGKIPAFVDDFIRTSYEALLPVEE